MTQHTAACAAALLGAALLSSGPAEAGIILNYGAFDSLSAFPTAGAVLDTRLSTAAIGQGAPLAWTTALVLGNGSWEMGLVSNVVTRDFQDQRNLAAFDNLAPWGRFKLPSLWGIPLGVMAGITVPTATGSATTPGPTAGVGMISTFDWDGDKVDINLGVRANPASPGDSTQGVAHVLFTHPFPRGLVGSAEVVIEVGQPAANNLLIERLGFAKSWNDNWTTDLAFTVSTPLGGGGLPSLAPTFGLTYGF